MEQTNLLELLNYIDPSLLDYQGWVNVGMALKKEGYTPDAWDAWSSRDAGRYHPGECAKKWDTFQGGSGVPVTAGTIVQMAKERGWRPSHTSSELDWDGEIGASGDLVVVNTNWIEDREIIAPEKWNPVKQLTTYLETLFEASENVGYVTECWEKEGKFLPTKGSFDRTAGELIEQLNKCKGDIGSVLGDCSEQAGAWIRFNPLDGHGVKNENVTDYRFALVESDTLEIHRQNAILRELELPIACLVHSGGKSLHAIVRVDAANYDEYRKRVDYLYEVCQKNGLELDRQNRNPSRLSRMPGVMRNGSKQFLVDTNIGKSSWNEWKEWIESVNDDLPDTESMADAWDNLPELSPPLISGVLRQGHKMLIAGPSKAGKSYALIELCCAIAEGKGWFGWQCTQGRVLYVNLELDRASCLHRFRDVYTALGWTPQALSNIDIWNLRGRSAPMDKLAPKLIRRAAKKQYIAIIIDPIYKVITGDENSADQMANFCNQFDKVCTELGCAVIYCHHHSKGAQGGKRSMDRASGSGVFARDPDALLDIIELEVTDALRKQEENKAVCRVCENWLMRFKYDYTVDPEIVPQDDLCSAQAMIKHCERILGRNPFMRMMEDVTLAKEAVRNKTAWRIEGTLREFPKFQPLNMWFDYPIHKADVVGSLKDLDTGDDQPAWRRNFDKKRSPQERKKGREESLETAFEACGIDGKVTVQAMAEYMGVTEKTVRNRIREHSGFWIDDSQVGRK